MVQDIAQSVATLEVVLDLAEDLFDFVFDGIGAFRRRFEFRQMRKELAIREVNEIIADQCFVTVGLTVFFAASPISLSVLRAKRWRVLFASEADRRLSLFFQIVKISEKQHPRRLLDVVPIHFCNQRLCGVCRRYF